MRLRSIIVVALAIGLLSAACSGASADEEPPATEPTVTDGVSVQDGDLVEVHYIGTLDDGSEFDSSRSADRGPFAFTVGTGQVIGGFDEAVRGRKVGDVRTVHIEPENAYGEWSEANVVEFPLDPEQGDIKAGDQVMLTSGVSAKGDPDTWLKANHLLRKVTLQVVDP